MTNLRSHIVSLGQFLTENPSEKTSSTTFLLRRIQDEVLRSSDVNSLMFVLRQAENVWTEADLHVLENALQRQVDTWQQDRGCGKTQDYSNFLAYFSAEDWNRLNFFTDDFDCSSYIIKHLGRLGLRIPNEQTALYVTSLMLALSKQEHSDDNALTQHQIFCRTKGLCRSMLNSLPRPSNNPPWVWTLPEDPNDLDARWMQHAFGTHVPVPCAINMAKVHFWAQEIPCRENNKKIVALKAATAPPKDNSSADAVLAALRIVSRCEQDPRTSAKIHLLSPLRRKRPASEDLSPPPAPSRGVKSLPMLMDKSPEKDLRSETLGQKQEIQPGDSSCLVTAASQLELAVIGKDQKEPVGETESRDSAGRASKRPAASDLQVEETSLSAMKKPAAKKTKNNDQRIPPQVLKRPSSSKGGRGKDYDYGDLKNHRGRILVTEHFRRKHYPEGCPKCRERPGCTLSCYKSRKQLLR
eukprot:Skav233424  [mRNA]  locus=scaffold2220:62940:64343:+ [translate_table: standard]